MYTRLSYLTPHTPQVPVYVSPAITPENGNNPTFRMCAILPTPEAPNSTTSYEFNRTTGELLDYTQYIGNLSDTDASAFYHKQTQT